MVYSKLRYPYPSPSCFVEKGFFFSVCLLVGWVVGFQDRSYHVA